LITANATPGTGTLFGTDSKGGNLITINTSTGTATLVGPTGVFSIPALAVDPTAGIMYAGQGFGTPNVYTVNPSTGLATLLGDSGLGVAAISGMDFRSDGTLFASVNIAGDGGTGSDNLATIDTGTGAATVIGPYGTCTGVVVPSIGGGSCTLEGMDAIAFAPDGTLYGATSSGVGKNGELYIINTLTGTATHVASILDSTGAGPTGGVSSLHFACDGTLYAGTGKGTKLGSSTLIKINPLNGQFTIVGSTGLTSSLGGLAFAGKCAGPVNPVGGTIIPVDMTSLFVAGVFTNAFWILPVLGAIVAASVFFKTKRKVE